MSLQPDAKPIQSTEEKNEFLVSPNIQIKRRTKKSESYSSPNYEIKHEEEVTIVQSDEYVQQLFVERKNLLVSSFEYPRDGNNPGLVLIFNQESFEDDAKSYRLGSRRDVNEIITCMSRLGFNINEEQNIFNDCTREDILKVVDDITSADLSEVNCLIVFFLTHGDSFNMLHTYDYTLQASEIWKKFAQCKHLKDKPKMFIFQACKGDDYSTVSSERRSKKIELVPDSTFTSDFIGPDMLIVYSTTEGNFSFRDPKTGTWFIQELCKIFSAYGRRDDVVALIIRTTKCLCRNYYHHVNDTIQKQMPIFISTLSKKFYLNRSKDRNILVKVLRDQENMWNDIKELEAKVEELLQEKEKRNK